MNIFHEKINLIYEPYIPLIGGEYNKAPPYIILFASIAYQKQ